MQLDHFLFCKLSSFSNVTPATFLFRLVQDDDINAIMNCISLIWVPAVVCIWLILYQYIGVITTYNLSSISGVFVLCALLAFRCSFDWLMNWFVNYDVRYTYLALSLLFFHGSASGWTGKPLQIESL